MRSDPIAGSIGVTGRRAATLFVWGALAVVVVALVSLAKASAARADDCPNALVRAQQAVQSLANCRAFEMVSPLDKSNGDVIFWGTDRSAPDGEGFEYEAGTAFAGAESAPHTNQYVSWRSPQGWTTEGLNAYMTPDPFPFGILNSAQGVYAMSEDLTHAVMKSIHDPDDRSGDTSEDQTALYLRKKGQGFIRLSPPSPTGSVAAVGPLYVGASTDMSRIFFQSDEQLTPDTPAGATESYEWYEGQVSLIGRLPNGEIALGGASVGRGIPPFGSYPATESAIAKDGSQVVLTMGTPSQLYLREGGHSRLISYSQREGAVGEPAPDGATFVGTTSEGGRLSTIYFVSPDLLTNDAEGGEPTAPNENELYAYDMETGKLSFLSIDTEPANEPGNEVGARVSPYWMASSEDGSYVYFGANSKLTPDASTNGGLYLWHDGTVRFVAALAEFPNTSSSGRARYRISADGRRLLFIERNQLTEAPVASNVPEAYLYDADSDELNCISCRSDGTTVGEASFQGFNVGYGGLDNQMYLSRNLSRDGSRAFFESTEALVPGDINGAPDVYEWHDGSLHLVSTGRWPTGARLLDASANGRDVFIATREPLVWADTDNFADVYDSREDGGFLEATRGECSAGACQGEPGGAASWSAPGSATVAGAGNVVAGHRKMCIRTKKGAKKKKKKAVAGARQCGQHKHRKKHRKHAQGKQHGQGTSGARAGGRR